MASKTAGVNTFRKRLGATHARSPILIWWEGEGGGGGGGGDRLRGAHVPDTFSSSAGCGRCRLLYPAACAHPVAAPALMQTQ